MYLRVVKRIINFISFDDFLGGRVDERANEPNQTSTPQLDIRTCSSNANQASKHSSAEFMDIKVLAKLSLLDSLFIKPHVLKLVAKHDVKTS